MCLCVHYVYVHACDDVCVYSCVGTLLESFTVVYILRVCVHVHISTLSCVFPYSNTNSVCI